MEKLTKEKYFEIEKEIKDSIANLSATLKETQQQYLRDNAEFKVGDKVRVWQKKGGWGSTELMSTDCTILEVKFRGYSNLRMIDYTFGKIKKDGTPSQQSAGIYSYEKIELI